MASWWMAETGERSISGRWGGGGRENQEWRSCSVSCWRREGAGRGGIWLGSQCRSSSDWFGKYIECLSPPRHFTHFQSNQSDPDACPLPILSVNPWLQCTPFKAFSNINLPRELGRRRTVERSGKLRDGNSWGRGGDQDRGGATRERKGRWSFLATCWRVGGGRAMEVSSKLLGGGRCCGGVASGRGILSWGRTVKHFGEGSVELLDELLAGGRGAGAVASRWVPSNKGAKKTARISFPCSSTRFPVNCIRL